MVYQMNPAATPPVVATRNAWSLPDISMTAKITSADTAGAFALVEYTAPPYFLGIAPHWHVQTTEWLYVVDGTLAVTCGEETVVVGRGTSIVLPPGIVHSMWNPSATRAIFLVCAMPGGLEHYCEEFATLVAAAAQRPPGDGSTLAALAAHYDLFEPPGW